MVLTEKKSQILRGMVMNYHIAVHKYRCSYRGMFVVMARKIDH